MASIPLKHRWLYASGSFGTGVFSTVPSVLMLYFCTEILGLNPGIVAVILIFPKLLSLLWDPMVGAWSDGFSWCQDRRKPFLLAGSLLTAIGFLALFAPPELSGFYLYFWVASTYCLLSLSYSLFAVPYTAIPADFAAAGANPISLVTPRMMLLMIGILSGAALAPVVIEWFGGGRSGYAAMGVSLAAASVVFMLMPLGMPVCKGADASSSLKPALGKGTTGGVGLILSVFRNQSYRWLLLSFLFQAISYGGLSAAIPYIVSESMGLSSSFVGLGLGGMILCSFICVPLWGLVAERKGELFALAFSSLTYGASAMLLAVTVLLNAPQVSSFLMMAVLGVSFAGLQVVPFTAAANVVGQTASGDEAGYAGVWIATEKLSLAGGASVLGVLLSLELEVDMPVLYVLLVPLVGMVIAVLFAKKSFESLSTLKRIT